MLVDDDGELKSGLAQPVEQGRSRSVSGTSRTGSMIAETGTLARRAGDGDRTLDVDDAVDVVPVLVENREAGQPGAFGGLDDVGGRGGRWTATPRGRGVMTSDAVLSPKSSDLVSRTAVPSSSVPAWRSAGPGWPALRGARPESSSWGSIPIPSGRHWPSH